MYTDPTTFCDILSNLKVGLPAVFSHEVTPMKLYTSYTLHIVPASLTMLALSCDRVGA